MNERIASSVLPMGITAVERETGLSKDTLRVWERRYGFPQPERDEYGERLYPVHQVAQLRVVKRLMDQGHRPGKLMALRAEQRQALLADLAHNNASAHSMTMDTRPLHSAVPSLMALLKQHHIAEMRRQMQQALVGMGLKEFVIAVLAPLNQIVGKAWMCNDIEIFEEHLYTESVQMILRNAINSLACQHLPSPARPKILLTTFPQEPHGLGLLMAEALMALDGCYCISLGAQTPIRDMVLAVRAKQTDVIALSFSSYMNGNQAVDGLHELRLALPTSVQIWAGGSCPVLQRRPPEGVTVFNTLDDIASAITHWRQACN